MKSWRAWIAWGGAILALLLLVAPTAPRSAQGSDKLSRELDRKIQAAAPDDLVSVIVQTSDEPSTAHFARLHGRGGAVKARHESIRGYSARVPASQLEALADDPEVEHISWDAPVKAHMDIAWRAVRGDAAVADEGVTGKGVGVAVIDTGVASHGDLVRPKGNPQVVEVEIVGHENGLADYYGHGTHVAGIINGSGALSSDRTSFRTFRGIAPGANLLSIRALAPDGTGYTSDIVSGIDWAIRFKTTYNIRVINLSLGHPVYESYTTDPICLAVRKAYDNGILVVVAAGNDGAVGSGYGTITSPGNEPTALTVGATDDENTVALDDDVPAWYSSKGPTLVDFLVKPDMVAPGTAIVSLRAYDSYVDTNYHQFALTLDQYKTGAPVKDGDYFEMSGTSMATPMVSGAAALMFQDDPSLTPATVKARLMKSAVKDSYSFFQTGAGTLDVAAALKEKGTAKDASSPRVVVGSDGYMYVEELGLIWGGPFSLGGIWGKTAAKMIDMTAATPQEITSAYGGIWGKTSKASLSDNTLVTSTGLIWGGMFSCLDATTGMVSPDGGVWGVTLHGGKR